MHMASREELAQLRNRCIERGVACSEVQDRGPNQAIVDVPDPDGTLLRFLGTKRCVSAATGAIVADLNESILHGPPVAGDETATLLGSLERQRAIFAWKCGGLDAAACGLGSVRRR
jgi:hypothetical protein